MDCVRADGVSQLGEYWREGKANDREKEGGGETPEQAGAKGEATVEAKDQEGKSHGGQQRGGREELLQQQLVNTPTRTQQTSLPTLPAPARHSALV